MTERVEFKPTSIDDLSSQYDVIIIGAGSTGLTSALELTELGKKVVVLEKMEKPGGNSMRTSSGMNAAETAIQRHEGIIDSYESFYEDTYKGGGKQNDVEMLKYFTSHADSAVEWLKEHDVVLDEITLTGGMSVKRAHRPSSAPAIGGYLIHQLLNKLAEEKVPVVCGATVREIDRGDNHQFKVDFADAQGSNHLLNSAAIILATGGFAASDALIKKYRPDLVHYKTTNHPGATGDGLQLAENLGAQLVDMDQIQVHPTVYQDGDHAFLIGEMVRGEGATLVNQSGHRFVNELDTRKVVTDAINAQTQPDAYLIFNAALAKRASAIGFYDHIGLVQHGDHIDELAKTLGLPVANLKETMQQWSDVVAKRKDEAFGRTMGLVDGFEEGPYMAIHIAPAIHYTMGGLKTSAKAEVLDKKFKPIKGLYAGGEVAGGLHGNNRIGGNSIAETVVFGLQAARQAFKNL
ncbi:flavocytochrome c [Pediococcus pentosaceus]|uniref:flavocytochrome c n=1 Tax=Pediococcus pentosaceus TaxID=1255 RepID=UPI0003C3381B|nr:flavocytochrome c [Pediococcus pentosaceus]AHA04556.1 cytochrome C [Pediococcus pentosaceus SL4]